MGLKTGLKRRTPKGDISIDNNNGSIRLRWRYLGNRYLLHIPYTYCPENMGHASIKAAEIKLDMLRGCFDLSLERYKKAPKPETSSENLIKVNPVDKLETKVSLTKNSLAGLAEEFTFWTVNIKNIDITNSFDYLYTRRLLEKWVDVLLSDLPAKMNAEKWASTTYNRRISYLSNFFEWMVSKGSVQYNPFKGITKRRAKKGYKKASRKPLSEEEILKLLQAIKDDTYCSPLSRYKHSHYYPFLKFLFLTGVRNAEAVGLKVKYLNWKDNTIEISETFARTVKGTNHAARVSKGTKMDNSRFLPFTDDLKGLLFPLIAGKSADEFVFTSPKGLSINDHTLGKRIVKPVLKKMGIDNRDLYAARHSFGTRAAQQGMAITDIAYLMGHTNIETAMRNYITVSKTNVNLPNLKLDTKDKGKL